ncbi:CarboxypepD_reg-like domain-containing protein [Marivirga sericea]|uniref:CarboxypepD_reg-like domain-containing protein n=1 Tax=Marivirga sericea TaxID=1028 RepID=A0A1X7LDT5_9BACT|nr:carboxypeptidase-like regulatory domain-containing protein [Marivirga sericea]SMG51860.1 CarboxypepD_reg-like domain-containing protein [Marivirga sericea]
MGKRYGDCKLKLILLLVPILLLAFHSNGQVIIEGKVKAKVDSSSVFATVAVKDSADHILAYTNTANDGSFKLTVETIGKLNLQVSSLGYLRKSEAILAEENDRTFNFLFFLLPDYQELNEVVVKASRPVLEKKDTIVFDAASFSEGNEEVVEDLLKKIPGLTIDGNGTITVGNQEVEKVMVEGDDFFEKGYQMLTKNMPSHPIEKVELLQNYSNNKLLKGIEKSDKVALNLILNEEAKSVWFGTAKLGYDVTLNKRYEGKANVMNFGKKNKYFFFTNLNSIGYDATGNINNLLKPKIQNGQASVGDAQDFSSLIQLSAEAPNFKRSRINFNDSRIASLNAIFNPIDKLKIKTIGFFNVDNEEFSRTRTQRVQLSDTSFSNTEIYQLNKENQVAFGNMDVIYDINNNQTIALALKYDYTEVNDSGDLIFNGLPTNEDFNSSKHFVDQKLTYSNKLGEKTSLLVTGRYINTRGPQVYNVDRFLFRSLFPTVDTANSVSQRIDEFSEFAALETHFLNRSKKDHLLELRVGTKMRTDKMASDFTIKRGDSIATRPAGFQNSLTYQVHDTYFNSKYRYELNKLSLIGEVGVHRLVNSIADESELEEQRPMYFNPSLALDWKIDKKNKLKASVTNNTTNSSIVDVYDGFVYTGFRNFNAGTGAFNQLTASGYFLNYQFGNWSNQFFTNAMVVYTNNHDFFSTNTLLSPTFSLSEKILVKDQATLSSSLTADYYVEKLASNVKAKLSYAESNFQNRVNFSELREITSINYSYGFEYRSVFSSKFNFNAGSDWTQTEIKLNEANTFRNNMSFLDIFLMLTDKLDIQLQSERYYFGNVGAQSTYYFIDVKVRYRLLENKLSFELDGRNMLNTAGFRGLSVSDIGSTTSEYRLLPRFILFKTEFRF